MSKEKLIIEDLTTCSDCGSKNLTYDEHKGEIVCQNCGLVMESNIIDQGPDWRKFQDDQNSKEHVGAPATLCLSDKGLSTEISWKNKDCYGNSLSVKNRSTMYRLRKLQKRSRMDKGLERNYSQALGTLSRYCELIGIPQSIKEDTAYIYRKAAKKNIIRGRSIDGVIAASIYTACRKARCPRTLDEVAEVTMLSHNEIGRTYRYLVRVLHIQMIPPRPTEYIDRFCSELGLSVLTKVKAMELTQTVEERALASGRGPIGVAAACIYIACKQCNEEKTQREIADVTGVTEVTIRNRYKEICEKLELDIYVPAVKKHIIELPKEENKWQ